MCTFIKNGFKSRAMADLGRHMIPKHYRPLGLYFLNRRKWIDALRNEIKGFKDARDGLQQSESANRIQMWFARRVR